MELYVEFKKAKELMKNRNYEEAERILKKIYSIWPSNLIFKLEYAKILIKQEENEQIGTQLLEDMLGTWNDKYATLELGKLSVKNKDNQKAREYFNKLLENDDENIRSYALKELVYLEIIEQNYSGAYKLFDELLQYNCLRENEKNRLNFYLKYQLGLLTEKDIEKVGYFGKQLLNYSDEALINLLKDKFNLGEEGKINRDTTIEEVIEDTKEKLQSLNPIQQSLVDKYIVEYDYKVGLLNGVSTNTMEVLTYSNTKTIMTMTPIKNRKVNYESQDLGKLKTIKKESQIDKFNRKYNLG